MTVLTRRYRFSASHRLHSRDLSDSENARIYGKCNNPFGHGHDYVLKISVAGPVDQRTGLIVSVPALDTFVKRHILQLFANRNINLDVPQFEDLATTTENVTLVIAGLIQECWPDEFGAAPVRVCRVHIQETGRNGFEILLGAASVKSPVRAGMESVTVHG